jgi:acyl-CoA synthetase (AMP-forming)/AMP-acid ligase II
MVPTMFRRLLALRELDATDRASLRCLISSGAPLSPETQTGILERITRNFYQFYSSTESGGIALLPPWFQDAKRDTVGIGVFGKELRIADDGEILSRGPAVTAGYVANADATAASFDGDWYRTGDLGRLDDDGFLSLIGRKKEMIISGGLNIYPAEIERVLYAHPAVAEAAIVGVPDAEWGESACAFVQLRPDHRATEADLIEHCRARLASYKKPRRVVFLAELPRTSNGKIARAALKA